MSREIGLFQQPARADFPGDEYIIHVNEESSIFSRTGLRRRPDVWVEDKTTKRVVKIYEAETDPTSSYVRSKIDNYKEKNIPHEIHPVEVPNKK